MLFVFLSVSLIFSFALPIGSLSDIQSIQNPLLKYVRETVGAPEAIDPATNYESFGSGLNELIYETLVDYKGNSAIEFEGLLAERWNVSPDGLQYNFTLRHDVTFHDGVHFNAYVMKYSLDRMVIMNDHWGPAWMIQQAVLSGSVIMGMDDVNISQAISFVTGGAFVVIDEFTFQINLESAYTPIISTLAYQVAAAVSPKALVENIPADYTTDGDHYFGQLSLNDWFPGVSDTDIRRYLGLAPDWVLAKSGVVPSSPADSENSHDWMADHAIGTGPYKLVLLDSGTKIVLEKNSEWWGTFAEYSVDEIHIKDVAHTETRITDLLQGDADEIHLSTADASSLLNVSIGTLSFGNVLPEFLDIIKSHKRTTFSNMFLGMNLNRSLPEQYILEDINSGYDAGSLAAFSWNNTPGPNFIPSSPNNPFTALAFRKAFAYSLDYASLIEVWSQGFAKRMEGLIPEGMLGHHNTLIEQEVLPSFNSDTAKELFRFVNWTGTINLVSFISSYREVILHMLADTINALDVGINVNVLELPWALYLDAVRARELPIFFLGWAPNYADPDDYIRTTLHSRDGDYATKISYFNPTVDILIDNASRELDPVLRNETYNTIEEIAAADSPYICCFQSGSYFVVRSWIEDFEKSGSLNPMSFMPNFEHINKVGNYSTTTADTSEFSSETTTTESIVDGTSGFQLSLILIMAVSIVKYKSRLYNKKS